MARCINLKQLFADQYATRIYAAAGQVAATRPTPDMHVVGDAVNDVETFLNGIDENDGIMPLASLELAERNAQITKTALETGACFSCDRIVPFSLSQPSVMPWDDRRYSHDPQTPDRLADINNRLGDPLWKQLRNGQQEITRLARFSTNRWPDLPGVHYTQLVRALQTAMPVFERRSVAMHSLLTGNVTSIIAYRLAGAVYGTERHAHGLKRLLFQLSGFIPLATLPGVTTETAYLVATK